MLMEWIRARAPCNVKRALSGDLVLYASTEWSTAQRSRPHSTNTRYLPSSNTRTHVDYAWRHSLSMTLPMTSAVQCRERTLWNCWAVRTRRTEAMLDATALVSPAAAAAVAVAAAAATQRRRLAEGRTDGRTDRQTGRQAERVRSVVSGLSVQPAAEHSERASEQLGPCTSSRHWRSWHGWLNGCLLHAAPVLYHHLAVDRSWTQLRSLKLLHFYVRRSLQDVLLVA